MDFTSDLMVSFAAVAQDHLDENVEMSTHRVGVVMEFLAEQMKQIHLSATTVRLSAKGADGEDSDAVDWVRMAARDRETVARYFGRLAYELLLAVTLEGGRKLIPRMENEAADLLVKWERIAKTEPA